VDGDNKPALVALRRRRDQVIEQLSDAFAGDALGLDDYEDRITLAHRASSLEELDRLVEDLAAPAQPAADAEPASQALATRAPADLDEPGRRDRKTMIAIFSGVQRKGGWTAARSTKVLAIFGGAELDFRNCDLPAGVTELRIRAVMGGVEIIVPPTLHVECDGWAVMGGFEDLDRAPTKRDPDAPLLRITGYAVMGGVHIETRLPGETGRDARNRRRRERRALRRNARRQLGSGTKQLPGSND